MNLQYRGISYKTAQANVEVAEEVIGRYRGATVSRHIPKHLEQKHPQGLKYRGAVVR